MEYVVIGLVVVALLAFFLLKEYFDSKRHFEFLAKQAVESFGHFSNAEMKIEDLERLKKLFYRFKDDDSIDDITANDLEIDELFLSMNIAKSNPGSEAFYRMLRTPIHDAAKRKDLNDKIEFLLNNENERIKFQTLFLKSGYLNKLDFFSTLDLIDAVKPSPVIKECLVIFLLAISILLMFFKASLGATVLLGTLIYGIVSYYNKRGRIEPFIVCFSYIANLIIVSKALLKLKAEPFNAELSEIKSNVSKLSAIERFSKLIVGSKAGTIGAGNPLEIIMDYLRMLLHIDIIAFYRMLSIIKRERKSVEDLYLTFGSFEAIICAASVRKALPASCVPQPGVGVKLENCYHPLIANPVKNSIDTKKGILITGSNASGKSTFLKTVALNILLAETIGTCAADSAVTEDCYLFSSMSLRDDLMNSNSYFMVEIKAVKRIFDYAGKNPEHKVICFVDELLRGTNTIERIASCSQILKNFSDNGVLCFAATHDYELTEILESVYTNYHFDEEIKDDDVLFNYRLKSGKATSRNAIKLLSIMGFADSVVENAKDMSEEFSKTSVWRIL